MDKPSELELSEKIRNFVLDGRLLKSFASNDPQVVAFLSAHILDCEGAFPHEDIFFWDHPKSILRKQKKLVKKLSAHPDFVADIIQRGPLKNIEARVVQPYPLIISGEVDESRLLEQGRRWMEIVEFLQVVTDSSSGELDDVLKEISHQVRTLCALPSDQEEASEEEFKEWVSLYVMIYIFTEGGQRPRRLKKLLNLEAGAIDYLAEEYIFAEALQALAKSFPKPQRKAFLEVAHMALNQKEDELKDLIFVRHESVISPEGLQVLIVEVHPDQGIFRGFVGNDCSTAYSFGFPYSPMERTYYVFDGDKNILGYICASQVKVKGELCFYLHTIAGPQITFAETDLILRAFVQQSEKLGVTAIYLPEDHRINENVNFVAIDRTMKALVKDEELIDLEWLDKKYRDIITDNGSASHYDDPDRNQWGRRLRLSSEGVVCKVSEREFLSPRTSSIDHLLR